MRVCVKGLLCVGIALAMGSGRGSAGDEFKPDAGFVAIFNGKNLDGWKTTKGESLDGKTDAYSGRFKVEGGKLIIDGKMKGNAVIHTAKDLGKDGVIKFEFMPGEGCNNDLYFRNNKFDITLKLKGVKAKEWNVLEITAKGDDISFKVNGEAGKASKFKSSDATLGIRAEFGIIEFRHMQAKQ